MTPPARPTQLLPLSAPLSFRLRALTRVIAFSVTPHYPAFRGKDSRPAIRTSLSVPFQRFRAWLPRSPHNSRRAIKKTLLPAPKHSRSPWETQHAEAATRQRPPVYGGSLVRRLGILRVLRTVRGRPLLPLLSTQYSVPSTPRSPSSMRGCLAALFQSFPSPPNRSASLPIRSYTETPTPAPKPPTTVSPIPAGSNRMCRTFATGTVRPISHFWRPAAENSETGTNRSTVSGNRMLNFPNSPIRPTPSGDRTFDCTSIPVRGCTMIPRVQLATLGC
jgi:hypothetical protein